MAHGMYYYMKQAWKKPNKEKLRKMMIEWRKGEGFMKVDKPLRLDKARQLGFKAKKGFILIRAKIDRGGRRRPLYGRGGRKPSKTGLSRYTSEKSLQKIVEQRVQKKYVNLEVLGSYYVAQDGRSRWFEIILVDPRRPEIKSDKNIRWITERQHKGRVFRH